MKLVACVLFLGICNRVAWGQCAADEMDLCTSTSSGEADSEVGAAPRLAPATTPLVLALALVLPVGGAKHAGPVLALLALAHVLPKASAADPVYHPQATCTDIKEIYRASECCGQPTKVTNFNLAPMPRLTASNLVVDMSTNPCAAAKLIDWPGNAGLAASTGFFNNKECGHDLALEQSGTNVTAGYTGDFDTLPSSTMLGLSANRGPITSHYWEAGMCAVNVHWHLGAEHLSVGQYDQNGIARHFSLNDTYNAANLNRDNASDGSTGGRLRRRLGSTRVRKGFSCHLFTSSDTKYTTEYNWKHCRNTHVGETYEIHWPHSKWGWCGTPWQYQTPFYDGVFCNRTNAATPRGVNLHPLNVFETIGVQAQVFTIVNDEQYYYPDLMRGMIVNGEYGRDISYYTGSTTGTSRDNDICSSYSPITWQVDRKCHLISASSFDKLCRDMLAQSDDMSPDVAPTGARVLVSDAKAANQNQR